MFMPAGLSAVLLLGGLAFALATMLVIAGRFLAVQEDPRVGRVADMLPQSNCGGCGLPGCTAFAEAVVAGNVLPGKCSGSTSEDRGKIAHFLGVDVGAEEKRVARVACAGGRDVARQNAQYAGTPSCAAATLVGGGGKACLFGCLGLADCAVACDFDAIEMNEHSIPIVNDEKCTACGDCVRVCPKNLFSLQPISQRLFVACASRDMGRGVLDSCDVGCSGCTKCAKVSEGQIEMRDHLPIIDGPTDGELRASIDGCPSGAIVWLDPDEGPQIGAMAVKKRLRRQEKEAAS